MSLKERQKNILNAAIREYIKTARPVASRAIAKKSGMAMSSATVRNEMLELDRLGYLEQPHTSAGRIPTDRGYRFFVDNLIEDLPLSLKERRIIAELFRISDAEEFIRDAARAIAQLSSTFTTLGFPEENKFYDAGLSEVLEEPEFQEPESVKMFGRLVDKWEEEMRRYVADLGNQEEERIFIGKENLFQEARSCAIFVSRWEHPKGFSGFITMISPKRTNYPHHRAFLKGMKNQF